MSASRPRRSLHRALLLRNRQRLRRMDLRILRAITQRLLREACPNTPFDLAVHIVAAPEMALLNEKFLRHEGPTDVITFDYLDSAAVRGCPGLHGEIVVCIDEAESQARRYHTTWQREVVRYIVHGLLHLLGYDDQNRASRCRMKASEDTLLCQLARRFDFRRIAHTTSSEQDNRTTGRGQ